MSVAIVMTVVCDDHPGIVEALSEILTHHGGNWTESSMMTLAGKFAGILLVEVPEAQADAFVSAVQGLGERGISVVAQRSDATPERESARECSIELVGQDHPGIVHEITEVLARHGINVLELETTVQSASMSGESLFMAHAKLSVPAEGEMDRLQTELEDLANELMVDISMER